VNSRYDSRHYLPGMDGLRALAAIGVFCVHLNQILDVDVYWGVFDLGLLMGNGEVGVALFFVLSGFLLSRPFIVHLRDGGPRPSLRRYWLHRIVRILPAYYLCLLLLVWLGGTWQAPEGRLDLLLHLLFVFNLAEFSILSIKPVFWTLAVEMQFYLLLPLVLVLRRQLISWLLVIAGASYLVHAGLNQWFEWRIPWPWSDWQLWLRPHGAVLNHSLFGHLPHFILGIGAAALADRPSLRNLTPRGAGALWALVMFALLLLLGTGWADRVALPYGPYHLPGVPLLLSALVLLTPLAGAVTQVLEYHPVRYLGRISYGIYLYHLPVMWLVDRQMMLRGWDAQMYSWQFSLAALSLSLAAASLSYFVVERPVQRMARHCDDPLPA
jgi:peptidoglycan/LPS O-acetylase OafA/YrhL